MTFPQASYINSITPDNPKNPNGKKHDRTKDRYPFGGKPRILGHGGCKRR
jgi:hypothetical protein